MKKTAILIGATGATGRDLLSLLLTDPLYDKIILFVRRDINFHHEKVTVHVVDFDHPEEWQDLIRGNVMFSCLGTTLKDAGSKAAQWKVDYTYQFNFAKIADINEVETYVLISSAGADAQSFFFYNKMKGRLEQDIQSLPFKHTIIFRPGPLVRKDSNRKMEQIALRILYFLNKIGLLLRQKPIATEKLAQAMVKAAENPKGGIQFIDQQTAHLLAEA